MGSIFQFCAVMSSHVKPTLEAHVQNSTEELRRLRKIKTLRAATLESLV